MTKAVLQPHDCVSHGLVSSDSLVPSTLLPRKDGLFRTLGYSTNVQGFGKTLPRLDLQTQHKSGRTNHQTVGCSNFVLTFLSGFKSFMDHIHQY